jgi:hypothetical protein
MVTRKGSVTVSEITVPRDIVEGKHTATMQREEGKYQHSADANLGKVIWNLEIDPGKGRGQTSAEILNEKYKDLQKEREKNPYTRLVAAKRHVAISKTSDAVIAKHLPGSRLHRLKKNLLKNLEEFPLFQELHLRPASFTAETLEELKRHVHDHAERLLSKFDATGWQVLQKCIPIQEPIAGRTKQNSDYRNTFIRLGDMRPWTEFPTFDTIEAFTKSMPQLKRIMHEVLIENGARGKWFEEIFNDPGYFPSNEESSLSRNFQPFFAELSALIRLACRGFPSAATVDYGGIAQDSKWVAIGGGKCAMKRRNSGNPRDKVPDLVSYSTNGDYLHLVSKPGQTGFPARETQCLIVGDFKMATKFKHSMLLSSMGKEDKEAQKVVNQIHDYMDMSNNRYGYIITQNELIMFRRRDVPAGSGRWGQVDFSQSIPVSTKKGKINAMIVLWYFHVKYAVMDLDGGWELESCYLNCPEELRGTSGGAAVAQKA